MLTVHLHGHLSAAFGLGEGASATCRSLEAAGCRVVRRDLRLASHPSPSGTTSSHPEPPGVVPPAQLDLVHTNPNILESSPGLINPATLKAPLRIGYWAWELEDFPEGWQSHFQYYEEIWCPSAYCASSLSQRSPIPVIALPHLPDWDRLDAMRRQRQIRRPSHTFQFLALFDYWSTIERKNPAGAIAAFQKAFPVDQQDQNPPVELVIKCSSAEQFAQQHIQLQEKTKKDPRIHWVDRLLTRHELDQLFCSADALISLHRAEGFGLNLADAMAIGLPVVATAYSANLEFMPLGTAELIPWQPVALQKNCGDYRKGQSWAEPDLKAAIDALRRLVHDREHNDRIAQAAVHAIRERLSSERLSSIVRRRLGQLLINPRRQS